jgi:peptidoglycan/xylan/chitin deacetylase (PgdA/CDA1 family)
MDVGRRIAAAAALVAVAAVAAIAIVLLHPGQQRNVVHVPRAARSPSAASPSRPTAGAVPPGWVRGSAARAVAVPILMYHVIAKPPAVTPYPQLWVRPSLFRAQVRALHRAGYVAITLARAFAAWRRGSPVPRRPIVFSFDDGYRGDATRARPTLHRLGWPGVLNLELRNVQPGDITAAQVRSLIRAGWEIDSHTITHPDLTTVGPARLRGELVGSRRELRRRFGVPATFFCYPAGRYDPRVVAAVRAAGYEGATTELEGYARPVRVYELPRIRVDGGETPASLLAALALERR